MAIARVQTKTAFSDPSVTSLAVTFTSSPTADDLLVSALGIDKSSGTITKPTNWTLINDFVSTAVSGALAYRVAGAGESATHTWTWVTSHAPSAASVEYSGTATASVLDQSAEANSTGAVTSQTTETTGTTIQADEVAVAMLAADSYGNVDGGRAWSAGFAEIAWAGLSPDTADPALSLAEKILSAIGTVESTYSTTDVGDEMYATVGTFKAAAVAGRPPLSRIPQHAPFRAAAY